MPLSKERKQMNPQELRPEIRLVPTGPHLTQTQLAEKINAKQKSLSCYEANASLSSIRTLLRIAKVLKKPAGYFLEEQGGKKSLTRFKRGCGP